MSIENVRELLLWCTGLNYSLLIVWFGVFSLAHGWLYRVHTRWFALSVEAFDTINYAGMAIYKIGVMLFNLVPLLALCLLSSASAASAS